MPSSVTAIPPTLGRGCSSVNPNTSGSAMTSASRTWNWSPYSAAAVSPATAMKPARRTGCARPNMPYSSCRQMHPSANRPSAKITPPSTTRKIAKAIAGTAAIRRAPRSEPPSPPSPRRPRRGRRRTSGPRTRSGLRVRPPTVRPAGVCAPDEERPLAIRARSSRAEAPAAAGELGKRLLERLAREVRPQLVAEDELGVRRLPQQVVRQALLAARADDQVGVVHLGRVQARTEVLLGAAVEAPRGVDDLGAPAVVERDEQRDPLVARGQLFGPRHP